MAFLPVLRPRVISLLELWYRDQQGLTLSNSPYFGQAAWFKMFHGEKIPSAIERYQKEIVRVLSVLESVLSKQEWLVGGKCTIADISFIPWNNFAFAGLLSDFDGYKPGDFPAVEA